MQYGFNAEVSQGLEAWRRELAVVCLFSSTLGMAQTCFAHHSAAMFDDKKTVTVTGTIMRFEWSNPHVYIYLLQPTASGQTIEWEVECSPPSILGRLGWTRETLHTGDSITVIGRPPREQGKFGLLPNTIKYGDTILFDRKGELAQLAKADPEPTPTSTPSVKDAGIDGVWVTLLALTVEKALDTDKMALTAKGKTAVKRFDEKTMHPGAHCIPSPAPFFMITPDLKQITKAEGLMLIDGEFDGAQRTIHVDAAASSDPPDSIQGYSVGRWEGRTFVIDTTHFAYSWMGNSYGLPSSARKHLVERLTPDADGVSLTYHFELSDPEFLAAPVAGDVRWLRRPNLAYAPPKCDLENASRFARRPGNLK
jgi:hypothetical protein